MFNDEIPWYDRTGPMAREAAALARNLVSALEISDETKVNAVAAGAVEDVVRDLFAALGPGETSDDRAHRLGLLLMALMRISVSLGDTIDSFYKPGGSLGVALRVLEAEGVTY